MSMTRSIPCNNFCRLILQNRHGSKARIVAFNPSETLQHGFSFSANRNMQLQSLVITNKVHRKLHAALNGNPLPGSPPPPTPHFSSWVKWILQVIVSLALPFWKIKGANFLQISYQAERVLDIAEEVVEVVEDVAEAVEKTASEVSDNLPADGMLKDAIEWVEDASEDLAEGARLATNFIHKVDEIKDGLEEKVENLLGVPHADHKDLVGEQEDQTSNEVHTR